MNEYYRWIYGIRTVEWIKKWMNITDEYMVNEQLNEWILPMNIW